MIVRVWHGWTSPGDADAYERFLRETLFAGLRADVYGFRGGWALRRRSGDEEEFLVMTLFESLDAVRAFAGDDYETPVIEPEAARLLIRGDERAAARRARRPSMLAGLARRRPRLAGAQVDRCPLSAACGGEADVLRAFQERSRRLAVPSFPHVYP